MSENIVKLEKVNIYQKNILVLSDVNVNINSGEFVYLIGKTGSGKSSLLKILYADLDVNEGIAKIANFDLRSIREKEIPFLRRKIGIVFQDFQLLIDRSIKDNLLFVMHATGWKNKTEMENKAQEVLEKVGLGTKGFKFPHQLSGGEQQKVVIARALINDPELILADEPTGNLDPETSGEIMQILLDISKNGKAVLMATHDFMMLERFPSRILRCENGKVIE